MIKSNMIMTQATAEGMTPSSCSQTLKTYQNPTIIEI